MKPAKALPLFAALTFSASTHLLAGNLTTLHTFSDSGGGITNADGFAVRADLVSSGNTLYGTAPLGGTNGYGTVFCLSEDGSGFQVLHTFTGGADGAVPNRTLVLSSNMLYGTVGRGTNGAGFGSIFAMETNGSNFSLLYTFDVNTSGALGQPNGGLLLAGDTLYGTAYQGGVTNAGSIFAVTTNGAFRLLHLFQSNVDGENPLGTLVLNGNMLYGTARNGGSNGLYGAVFSIDTNGNNFTVLHTFSGAPSADEHNPDAGLILSGGMLYGTTAFGGTNGGGTVFSISTNGDSYTQIHSFVNSAEAGRIPEAAVLLRGDTLYGTTLGNGVPLSGIVFSVNTNGDNFTVLHAFSYASSNFGNTNSDGAQPYGNLVMSGDVLYGTTSAGGVTGAGTIFSLVVQPTVTSMSLAGTNLVLNGINGGAGDSYALLESTNAGLPLSQWVPLATNTLPFSGNFTFTATNAVDPAVPERFYILQTPLKTQ